MQLRHLFIATTLIITISSPCFAAGKSDTFKCWMNKQGIRECGNEVPPEYSQGETRTVNKYGITTNVEARAKTKEEAAAEMRAQEEQEKAQQAEQQKEQSKLPSKEQQNYDRVLLASYLSEEDINAARSRKLSAIDASIEMSKNIINRLEGNLNKLQQTADAQKKRGTALSADDQKDIDSLQQQITDKKAYITSKENERNATNLEYDGYVKRFRELKASKATQ